MCHGCALAPLKLAIQHCIDPTLIPRDKPRDEVWVFLLLFMKILANYLHTKTQETQA